MKKKKEKEKSTKEYNDDGDGGGAREDCPKRRYGISSSLVSYGTVSTQLGLHHHSAKANTHTTVNVKSERAHTQPQPACLPACPEPSHNTMYNILESQSGGAQRCATLRCKQGEKRNDEQTDFKPDYGRCENLNGCYVQPELYSRSNRHDPKLIKYKQQTSRRAAPRRAVP
ncbi:hypothetical protein V9T40_002945 [Parthenolecanium corni]|uniref:Uncharacterized protein n=1 Tax=Parthenolecanium corni TaxID=536013 RepID=A0AAN9Y4Y4_9HEMI